MEVEHKPQSNSAVLPKQRNWRRAMVASSTLVAMLMVGLGFLPPALLQTSMRNRVIGQPFADTPLTAAATAASGGWFTPLTFHDVQIRDPENRIVCLVKELRTSKGMLGFLTEPDEVGRLTLVEPRFEVNVDASGKWPEFSQRPSRSRLNFEIMDGEVVVHVPWRKLPIVDVSKLDVTGRVGPGPDGRRTLTVDATQVFDHESLSEAHTEQNLALIAPVLSQSTTVSGAASVWVDTVQIPLEGEAKAPFPIRGRAEFHSLQARLKEEWISQLAILVGGATGTTVPDRIEVVRNCEVSFEISETGIRHDSMVFLLPDLAEELRVTSSGTISLDESLDLRLGVKVPSVAPANRPVMSFISQLTAEPIQLAVKGTVSKPKLELPAEFAAGLLNGIAPAQHTETSPAVPGAIAGMVQSFSNPDKEEAGRQLTGSIVDLIRAIDHNARQKAKENPDGKPQKTARKKRRSE
ncbi:MAG: hypothetical protein ACK58L_09605 [Planctomycetota bacterium]